MTASLSPVSDGEGLAAGSVRDDAGLGVPPEGDHELAGERALRLTPEPGPGEIDADPSQVPVPGPADAGFVGEVTALVRGRRQADVRADLTPVP
jgi:hypothetical protein